MTIRDNNQKIVENVKGWAKLDNEAVSLMDQTLAKCDHPVVCTMIEIIRRDSELHAKVQKLIVDSFERKPLTMGLEQFGNYNFSK